MGRGKLAASPAPGTVAFFEATARAAEGAASMAVSPGGGILDERELKKQKRKQSNRESARRSRLRKQAEGEDLSSRVSSLEKLNRSLSGELLQMKAECQRLTGDNAQLQNQLGGVKLGKEKAKKESIAATNGVNGAASGLNGVERTA